MSSSISGLHYEENQVGGTFKSSKIEYVWEFILNGSSPNKIQLIYSKWTDDKKLIKNGIEVYNKKNDDSYLKNFEIDGHIFSVIQLGDKFELRVDNQSFTHLYNLEKNKNFFTGDIDPTSKTQIADNKTGDIISEKNENNFYIFKSKENDGKEKQTLFNFKIKIDENKANSGLKKFKFGPGIKPSNNKFNKNINNNQNNTNKDLLGFGDILQVNDTNNSSSNNNNNINNNDIFGLGIDNNDGNKNNQNNNNDIFNFGNNNNEINNNNFLNFDSIENNNLNENINNKTTNEQLADIFNALSQNNQSKDNNSNDKNTEQDKENIQNVQNDIPIENKQEINTNSNNNIFSFESLINELSSEKKILNFENNFLNEMNINFIINIDNDSKNKYKIIEQKYKNRIYKNINISKISLIENKDDFIKLCDLIRIEIINKGSSIYVNIDNYDDNNNDWIYVVIIFMTYLIQVNYLEIANYLRQKINFIKNISQIVNNCLNDDDFDAIFNN